MEGTTIPPPVRKYLDHIFNRNFSPGDAPKWVDFTAFREEMIKEMYEHLKDFVKLLPPDEERDPSENRITFYFLAFPFTSSNVDPGVSGIMNHIDDADDLSFEVLPEVANAVRKVVGKAKGKAKKTKGKAKKTKGRKAKDVKDEDLIPSTIWSTEKILEKFKPALRVLLTTKREEEGLEPCSDADINRFWNKHMKRMVKRAGMLQKTLKKSGEKRDIPDEVFEELLYGDEIIFNEALELPRHKYVADTAPKKAKTKASKSKKTSDSIKVVCDFEPSNTFDSKSKDPDKWPIYSAKFGAWKFQKVFNFKKGMTEEEAVKEVEKYLMKNWSKIEKSYFNGYIHDGVITVSDLVTLGPEDKVPKNRMSAHGKRHVVVTFGAN